MRNQVRFLARGQSAVTASTGVTGAQGADRAELPGLQEHLHSEKSDAGETASGGAAE